MLKNHHPQAPALSRFCFYQNPVHPGGQAFWQCVFPAAGKLHLQQRLPQHVNYRDGKKLGLAALQNEHGPLPTVPLPSKV
ncbi:MAG: hypothetical protein R2830_12175 [Saprospiraceae bacterium]